MASKNIQTIVQNLDFSNGPHMSWHIIVKNVIITLSKWSKRKNNKMLLKIMIKKYNYSQLSKALF